MPESTAVLDRAAERLRELHQIGRPTQRAATHTTIREPQPALAGTK
jgi:hypothetical protein